MKKFAVQRSEHRTACKARSAARAGSCGSRHRVNLLGHCLLGSWCSVRQAPVQELDRGLHCDPLRPHLAERQPAALRASHGTGSEAALVPSAIQTRSALLLHAPTGNDPTRTSSPPLRAERLVCGSGLCAIVRALALVNLTLLYFSSAGATTMLRSSLPMTSRLSRLPTSASAACDVVAGGGAYLVGTYLHARDFALLVCLRASRRKSSAVRGVGCIEPQRGAGGGTHPAYPILAHGTV